MMVLNSKCKKCSYECNTIHFKYKFIDWASGNNDIDKFIQNNQLLSHGNTKVLEWIPYNRFYSIKYITKDKFGKIYKANWIEGKINCWDHNSNNWKRYGSKDVILKSLDYSYITLEFMNKARIYLMKIEYLNI